jgi:hypothetical protein
VNEKSHRIRDYYHATMEVLRDIYEPDPDAGVGGKDKDIEQGKHKCIVYTGHSLGGGMAEVMGLLTDATQESIHLLGSRRMKHPLTGDTPVIAFSAPGGIPVVMKTMLGIGRKGTPTANKAKEDTAMKDMARNFHSMVNYFDRGDLVARAGVHGGTMCAIQQPTVDWTDPHFALSTATKMMMGTTIGKT